MVARLSERRTPRLLLLASALIAAHLCPTLAQHPPPHKHVRHTKTCGEGGEKDPKMPKDYNPPKWVYLMCGEFKIGGVEFASWGTPTGKCSGALGTSDSFTKGSCHAKNSKDVVEKLCVGKLECKLPAGSEGATDGSSGTDAFGDPCAGTPKRLAVVVTCDTGAWGGTFILVMFILASIYTVGGIAFSMKNGKSFGSDGLRVLPNYEQWAAIHSLYSDGVTFTLTKYYAARGIKYQPKAQQDLLAQSLLRPAGQVAGGGADDTFVPTGLRMTGYQGADDDALWSDDDDDADADFDRAKVILEDALPDLADDMEWETDSEEFE